MKLVGRIILIILVNYFDFTVGFKGIKKPSCNKTGSYLVNVFSDGSSIAHCHGIIISHDTVLTAAQCVFGYQNEEIHVCTTLVKYCPQDPFGCSSPMQVYIHNNYFNDLLVGEVSTPLALLKFEKSFFRQIQVALLKFPDECQCNTYVDCAAETFDCMQGQGLVKRSVYIDDFTYNGHRYGYVDPIHPVYYAIPYEASYQCVGLPGSPLISSDGIVIGIKIYCQKNCEQKSYSVYKCLFPFEFQFPRFEDIFIKHEELLNKLGALSLQEKVNLRRFLLNYDETAECSRTFNNSVNYHH